MRKVSYILLLISSVSIANKVENEIEIAETIDDITDTVMEKLYGYAKDTKRLFDPELWLLNARKTGAIGNAPLKFDHWRYLKLKEIANQVDIDNKGIKTLNDFKTAFFKKDAEMGKFCIMNLEEKKQYYSGAAYGKAWQESFDKMWEGRPDYDKGELMGDKIWESVIKKIMGNERYAKEGIIEKTMHKQTGKYRVDSHWLKDIYTWKLGMIMTEGKLQILHADSPER